jgi:hypothetical protein
MVQQHQQYSAVFTACSAGIKGAITTVKKRTMIVNMVKGFISHHRRGDNQPLG